ncbi:MAG: UDP-N-acetylmuramoyl-tripeptide--D-alanyl-D-alanine ligase [Anaerolineales bacterium]|jgi:UDP-N-acetylmuramoyl-tripeptide--D-alanyl-D-alanine ligase
MLTVGQVVESITGTMPAGLEQPISGTVIDSRLAQKRALFVALPGEQYDGHEFVADAFERGAILAIIDHDIELDVPMLDIRRSLPEIDLSVLQPPLCLRVKDSLRALQQLARYWRAKFDIKVIGITGSVGKSTTKELVADVLSRRFTTIRSPGNLNNEIGLPLSLMGLTEEHECAVLEMGFYVPGEIAELCSIARPQVGVLTNISQVHLERAGSMEAIVQGKGELVEALPPAPEGVAILNHDDPRVLAMQERTKARVFTYGLSPEADIWASDVEGLGLEGIRCVVHYGDDHIHLRVPLLGRHSVHTVLRAAVVGLVEGLTWQEIAGGLQDTHNQLRLMAVRGPGGSLLLDDTYNAAPTSVIAALNLLEDLEGRRIAVLGDMLELGEFEERGHRMVGGRAAQVADQLITVGERARWIADEARASGMADEAVVEFEDGDQVTEYLKDRIGEGDVVLVKGSRGMQLDLVVAALEQSG